ncbi:MAG: hypothetical protein NFW16_10015 [Candidatus Accumulibacter sp.]|uniref:hypothetical protein n=1 Tax=Accumulibacter sp. TaxID=2053492 RepID=UPI00258BFE3C|nr:hypothetical protein [Accumulibacter sp.]MCM8622048.1 hypothetical protein [Accumulibacter sp.]
MSTTPSERTQQRRRLLKAAASAPAIFTLNAGATGLLHNPPPAFSSTHCIANSQTLPSPPMETAGPDGWVRTKVTKLVPGTGQTVVTYELANNGQGHVYGGTCWNSFYQIAQGTPGSADGDNVLIP